MTVHDLVELVTVLVTAVNTGFILYFTFRKIRPQVRHLEVEADSELVDAANANLEGAKISAQMLLDRINELKTELDAEKRNRQADQQQAESTRKRDLDYFRRRIKDLERELRDYRSWAAKLAKQVVEAGKIPVSFIPSTTESDPSITAVRQDLEQDDYPQ